MEIIKMTKKLFHKEKTTKIKYEKLFVIETKGYIDNKHILFRNCDYKDICEEIKEFYKDQQYFVVSINGYNFDIDNLPKFDLSNITILMKKESMYHIDKIIIDFKDCKSKRIELYNYKK